MQFDKEKYRDEILKLLSENKASKNWYFKTFYDNKGVGHLYEIILNWFDHNEELKNASLAQKLYHIKENHEEVPPRRFVNCIKGYLKGCRHKGYDRTANSINYTSSFWFKDALDDHNYNEDNVKDEKEVDIELLKKCLKVSRYREIMLDESLVNYFFKMARIKNLKPIEYIIELASGVDCRCRCGKVKKLKKMKFGHVCENPKCLNEHMSEVAKSRGMYMLHNREVWDKSAKIRKGMIPSEESKRKSSESNKKFWTPEARRKQTEINEKNGVHKKQSDEMKRKIATGEFTPKSTNRLNHVRLHSDMTGIKSYRSSWELKYHEAHPHLKYEKTRIKYEFNDNHHVYIVDFTDDVDHIIYEIKPASLIDDDKVKAKHKAAREWANLNNYTFKIITENEFKFT